MSSRPWSSIVKTYKGHLKCFIRHLRRRSRSSLNTICYILNRISAFQVSRHHHFLCGNESPRSSDSRHAWLWQPQTKLYHWICKEGISFFLFNVNRTSKSLHGTNNKQEGSNLSVFMIVQSSGKTILGQWTVFRRKMIQDLREEARELSLFAKKIRTRCAAAHSKRQDERERLELSLWP